MTKRGDYTPHFYIASRSSTADIDLTTLRTLYGRHPDVVEFGRIEYHEAINAFARQILLKAKKRLEVGGWRVVHGIVDSIWVTPDPNVDDEDHEDLEVLATEITESVDIRLEHEAHYDWVAFVPQRESDASALTKYFGKVSGEDEFKVRGIEARQRSTPSFIEEVQRSCLERFDATRSVEAVLACLQNAIKRLHTGDVQAEQLVERNSVSKPLEGYTQNVAALKRARDRILTCIRARTSSTSLSMTRSPRDTVSPNP